MIPNKKAICVDCAYFYDGICQAFGYDIPEEIITGNNNHSKPLPSQTNDIVFKPIKK